MILLISLDAFEVAKLGCKCCHVILYQNLVGKGRRYFLVMGVEMAYLLSVSVLPGALLEVTFGIFW